VSNRLFPRVARLASAALVVALALPLVAQDRAEGFHDPAWIGPLFDRPDHTLNVVRDEGYLAWTEAGVCCTVELGYANGAGILPESARTFKVLLQGPGGAVEQLNPDGTWAMVGGIDRGVLAYATGRRQADIRLLDLKTRKQLRLPRGVNTPQVEYDPSISGKWLLFGRLIPSDRGDLWDDTRVILTNLQTGRSRVLARGKNYRTTTYPGQVNGDWVAFTACKFNKYGPNCGVTRYRISSGEQTIANLDGSCCYHGDPHTESYMGAGNVSASAVTADGLVYIAMRSSQNTSWCAYSEVWSWDREERLAYMFGVNEDDSTHDNYDEPYAGLVVTSLYVDGSDPHRVVFPGHTTHEDHGYECDVESSALHEMGRGTNPSATPPPTPAPETPSPTPTPEPTETPTPSPTPEPSPSPTAPPTPTPQPSPTCPLPVCV
jgi:hypothetical protein